MSDTIQFVIEIVHVSYLPSQELDNTEAAWSRLKSILLTRRREVIFLLQDFELPPGKLPVELIK